MSAQHTPGPKPLTQREQRTLERLQLKWGRKTITAEEKAYALTLSERAWVSSEDGRAAMSRAEAAAIAKATGSAS